jgi:transcription initiation factor IIE alpha subunit
METLQYGYLEKRVIKRIEKMPAGKKFYSADLMKELNKPAREIGRVLGVLAREGVIKSNGRINKSTYEYEVLPFGSP